MKRAVLCILIIAVLAVMPVAAEIELGVGISPPLIEKPEGAGESENPLEDMMLSFHVGYSFLWLFYASADAIMLPPYVLQSLTSTYDPITNVQREGIYRPGFINLINVGIRPRIGPIALMASVGINMLYVYKQDELPEDAFDPTGLGVNARVGAYLFLGKNLALTASATTVFANFDELVMTFADLASDDPFLSEWATQRLLSGLYPTIGLVFSF
jgi:hypothetical protein